MALEPQGEYIQDGYLDPTPAPPPPAPWYPPHPPTSDHLPPQTHYLPPHRWYNPQEAKYTPRRAPYRPRTRPTPRRAPRFETRRGHVTATRPARSRGPAGSNHDGPPRYVPPALRSEVRTSWRSQLPQTRPSKDWRDPPPHRDPPQSLPKRSDSPNWRAPSPNRPTSFKSPSPPPSESPLPPLTPTHIPKRPQTPPASTPESQLSQELETLIKNAAEALRTIVRVSQKLVRQVNAGRRLAHKAQQSTLGLREDALGNLGCSPPPTFPPGRGESVTRSPGASDSIA